jgi:hypothetical protein
MKKRATVTRHLVMEVPQVSAHLSRGVLDSLHLALVQ